MLETHENLVVRVHEESLFLRHLPTVSLEPALGGVMPCVKLPRCYPAAHAIRISAFAVDRSVSKGGCFVD